MTEKFTYEQIREYWRKQAEKHGQSPSVSWSDRQVIEMEIREVLKHLSDGDKVLDVGCAGGYSTLKYAEARNIKIKGVDYLPEMIEEARKRLESRGGGIAERVIFETGDVTALKEAPDSYDKVIVTRVIINLKRWEDQRGALLECASAVRPGGLLLLFEATLQGWGKMNTFRREWGLPDIPMPSFNNYLDEDMVARALGERMRLVAINNYSSTYYVGTRVLKPLLIKALGGNIDAADPDMEWNRWFASLPPWGDYGTQKEFVFEKIK